MRVLYESLFFDVTEPREVRGPGHVIYRVLQESADVDLQLLGPPAPLPWLAERLLRKIHRRLTGRRYLRFPLSQAARASAVLSRAARKLRPDVVLTMFPAALWAYDAPPPAVYRVDVTYEALRREYPEHGTGPVVGRLVSRFQARACRHAAFLVTHSEWSRDCLVREYGLPVSGIRVFPNVGGLPPAVVPAASAVERKAPRVPLRLLFVGLDAHRKGLDVALETVRLLNERGVPSRLVICGLTGHDTAHVHFAGRFDKSLPQELAAYANLFREADLLLHPARFDPSPMVIAEAAAFGLPAITQDIAGLGFSVLDGRTGRVLEARAPAAAHAQAIADLAADPDRYRSWSRAARERYDLELSWERFGEHLKSALHEARDRAKPDRRISR